MAHKHKQAIQLCAFVAKVSHVKSKKEDMNAFIGQKKVINGRNTKENCCLLVARKQNLRGEVCNLFRVHSALANRESF